MWGPATAQEEWQPLEVKVALTVLTKNLLVRRPGRGHPGFLGIAVNPGRVALPHCAALSAISGATVNGWPSGPEHLRDC